MTRPAPPVTDDPGRLVALMGRRRRPVVVVVSLTECELAAARSAAELAVRLGVPLTVAVLRPVSVWLGAASALPVPVPVFEEDYDYQITAALVRAIDRTGVSWRLTMLDAFTHTAGVVYDIDAGLVLLGAPHGWRHPVGRLRQLRRASWLSRRVSIPVGVWSERGDLSSRG